MTNGRTRRGLQQPLQDCLFTLHIDGTALPVGPRLTKNVMAVTSRRLSPLYLWHLQKRCSSGLGEMVMADKFQTRLAALGQRSKIGLLAAAFIIMGVVGKWGVSATFVQQAIASEQLLRRDAETNSQSLANAKATRRLVPGDRHRPRWRALYQHADRRHFIGSVGRSGI